MRLYVLGLNNPQGKPALDPAIVGSAGWRLWRLSTLSLDDWLKRTQRVNLLEPGPLPRDYRRQAKVRGEYLATLIRGRTVVLLGNDVSRAVGHEAAPLRWVGSWVVIPHPSGLCRFYNDPVCRAAVGALLTDLLYREGDREATVGEQQGAET